ncbi:MAG: ComF family protein [Armatimonadetes bacterium]|nr:ComF family protein [Armatimonadota bacterium]
MNSFFERILGWVYPTKCPVCRMLSEEIPCRRCAQSLIPERLRYVDPVAMVDELRAHYPYEGSASELVKALKYRRETALVDLMAGAVSEVFDQWDPEPDFIVPVPIHRRRLAFRGFNQARLLCEKLPSDLVTEHLVRIRATKPQVELKPEQRAKNLIGAFRCSTSLVGKRVLLVDDVFTTGATAHECAKAMKEAGAAWVGVLVFAMRRR